jgi:hypothetical protein
MDHFREVGLVTETKTEALAAARRERTVDKSDWGPGPWQDEPDLVQWTSEAPARFWCQVARNDRGALCGYVAVPPGHSAHGKDLGELGGLRVHGSVTYAGPGVAGLWVLGFDCGHSRDVAPAEEAYLRATMPAWMAENRARLRGDVDACMPAFRTTYKALPYVRAEVESLARQLAAIGPDALTEGGEP